MLRFFGESEGGESKNLEGINLIFNGWMDTFLPSSFPFCANPLHHIPRFILLVVSCFSTAPWPCSIV